MIHIAICKTIEGQRALFMSNGNPDDKKSYLCHVVKSSNKYPLFDPIELNIDLVKKYRDFLNKAIEDYEYDLKRKNTMSPALKSILELIVKEFAEKIIEAIENHLGSQNPDENQNNDSSV